MPIPALAFSIWYQGEGRAPEATRRAFAHNREVARRSGWAFRVFDADDLRAACETCGVRSVYDSYPRMHQRIDLGRLCLLFVHGGVSVDADQLFVRGFDALPHLDSNEPVLSQVSCGANDAVCHRIVSLGAPRALNNALVMSPRGSRTLLSIIHRIASRPILRTPSAALDVMATTGPTSFSHAVADMVSSGRVRTMPAAIVEPCSQQMATVAGVLLGGRGENTCRPFESSVAVHPYTLSWAGGFAPAVCLALAALVVVLCWSAALVERAMGRRRVAARTAT